MSAHVGLTEDSLRTHPRKGREGKGVGRENCTGVSPHPSTDCSGFAAHRRSESNQPATMDGGYAASLRGGLR
jgi:hypothetical protein